jgi:AraC-like DNA-binding protein
LAKIAVGPKVRLLGQGDGWAVADVVCASGPQDRPFEERHENAAVAVVAAGSFQYRSTTGRSLMTPGSLLLGNPGQEFECGHEHGEGDRCVSFWYAPDYFERVAADVGARGARLGFRVPRLPPLRGLSRLVAQACARLGGVAEASWEELGVKLAARAVQLAAGLPATGPGAPPSALARVTRAVRRIERDADTPLTLRALACEAGLSPYHFLRTFEGLTGLTPHQYLRRARLRHAAVQLTTGEARIVDVAFDSGFGDVSNFNRAFRAEFGVNPRLYRAQSER